MKHTIILTAAALMATSLSFAKAPQLTPKNIDKVVKAMTLEEKARLIVGTGMAGFDDNNGAVVGETRSIVPGAAGTTYPIPRLGIPAIVLADGPAGLRINPKREGDSETYYCTHFPIGTLLASTWDTALVANVGKAIGNEVLEYGVDVLLAPALNIHRNPLCGRNFEYYSEDPLVSGAIAGAYVRGVQDNGVGTSIKHFAGNSQETNRTGNDARMSERALREIYLKGFENCVKEADPWTVMSSYNYINGTYTSESPDLLTDILRDEWGYKGMVMTDWFGGSDAVAQMHAGNDMLQPGYAKQYEQIVNGVKDGTLSMADVDRNVKRILELIVRTPRYKGYKFSNKPDLKAHADVTRKSATEGMVLLENKGVLPLSKDIKNVAVYGCTSYDFIAGGTGSGNVNRAYTVSLLDGLKNAGFKTDDELQAKYTKHIADHYASLAENKDQFAMFMPKPLPDEPVFTDGELAKQAAQADVALITIGRMSGEFLDREENDFSLSSNNLRLINDVARAFHEQGKKVVVVMNVGGVIETASWKDVPDAVLCAWQAGQEGGNSVADILTGAANPCGKLTMTFPVYFQDHASSKNFPINMKASMNIMGAKGAKDPADYVRLVDYTPYEEDVYVGYRYFDSFGKDVSYPFGYGLSYTNFDYSNVGVSEKDGKYVVTVDVKNTGKYDGKEVVQVYVAAPGAKAANKPEHELKAFGKTRLLKPGESQTMTMVIDPADLASFDEEATAWVVAPGVYDFQVGASSRDIRGNAKAEVKGESRKVEKLMTPKVKIDRLKRI